VVKLLKHPEALQAYFLLVLLDKVVVSSSIILSSCGDDKEDVLSA
jgi:hypothetical protein